MASNTASYIAHIVGRALYNSRLRPSSKVTLVCPAPVVKAARVVKQLTPYLGVVDVEER